MSKLSSLGGLVLAALIAPAGAHAAVLGSEPAACAADSGRAAALVRVTGFKNHEGSVRVRAFPATTRYLFDKRGMVARVEVRTPANGSAEVCVPLPAPGNYAFDVRHDADDDGDTGMRDGGGMSGNPSFSVWQVITKHKPPLEKVVVAVGRGPAFVPIRLSYFQDGSFGPLASTASR